MATRPRRSPSRSAHQTHHPATSTDAQAERAALGAVLYDGDDERLDIELIDGEARRLLLGTAMTLRAAGHWAQPRSSHPRDERLAAHQRGTDVLHAIRLTGTWSSDPDVLEHEIWQALDATTGPDYLDSTVSTLLEVWRRRQYAIRARRIIEAAGDLTADIDSIAIAQDLQSLADGGGPRRSAATLLRLSDVQPTPLRWLWPGRIAAGKLTVIAGQPGVGKSLLSIDLAARVSRGWPYPDDADAGLPADVIMLSAEDDPADTIRPRLDAVGADVHRIAMLEACCRTDPETGQPRQQSVSLADLTTIRDALSQTPECRLLVVDPVSAYTSGVDSHRNSDMRAMLAPLTQLAGEHDVAIIAVTHLSKSSGDGRSAVERVMGSLALAAAARAVYVVGRDPDRAERRIVATAKNNLGPDATGLAYVVTVTDGMPVLSWEPDPVTLSADDLLAPPERDADSRGSALTDAIEWLRDQLADGPIPTRDLQAAARRDGMSWGGAVRRAKDALGVIAQKNGMDGAWSWTLPLDDEQAFDDAKVPTP